ncbi:hypothetical protein ACTXT7_016316 [Hymenolepis weldensis]
MCMWTPLKFQLLCRRTEFPLTVLVFGVVVVSGEGHIMTPGLFPQGLRVDANADAYVETLQTTVVKSSWIDSLANAHNSGNASNLAKAELDGLNNLANFSTSSSISPLHYPQGHSDSSSFISASLSRCAAQSLAPKDLSASSDFSVLPLPDVSRGLSTKAGFGESSSDNHSQTSLKHNVEHFRPPRPPPGIFHHSGGVVVGNVSGANGNINLSGVGVLTRAAASAASNCFAGFFDGGASSTCSSTTSTPSTPTRRQNRRTRLPPVKISSSGIELDDILRKIQNGSEEKPSLLVFFLWVRAITNMVHSPDDISSSYHHANGDVPSKSGIVIHASFFLRAPCPRIFENMKVGLDLVSMLWVKITKFRFP